MPNHFTRENMPSEELAIWLASTTALRPIILPFETKARATTARHRLYAIRKAIIREKMLSEQKTAIINEKEIRRIEVSSLSPEDLASISEIAQISPETAAILMILPKNAKFFQKEKRAQSSIQELLKAQGINIDSLTEKAESIQFDIQKPQPKAPKKSLF